MEFSGGGQEAGHLRTLEFVSKFCEAAKFRVLLDVGNQPRRFTGKLLTLGGEAIRAGGPVLRPGQGLNEAYRTERAGTKNLFGIDLNGARKIIESVMKGDDTQGREMREEVEEVLLRALVGMVAINPEQTNGSSPSTTHASRVGSMDLDILFNTSLPKRV